MVLTHVTATPLTGNAQIMKPMQIAQVSYFVHFMRIYTFTNLNRPLGYKCYY